LPANYAIMVSRRYIAIVNSHLHRYTLTRAVKHCDYRRLPFDDKTYTFEFLETTPQETIMTGGTAFLSVIYLYCCSVIYLYCSVNKW